MLLLFALKERVATSWFVNNSKETNWWWNPESRQE